MKPKSYFTPTETVLWCVSLLLIIFSWMLFDREDLLRPIASVIGVTSILLNAKGNPIGQALMLLFSILYALISYAYAYYGEMITYLGMTAPMAMVALIAWLRHPYEGHVSQVEVNRVTRREGGFLVLLTGAVTLLFFFILAALDTANLIPSTVSVTTSFAAAYLTFRRSSFFSLAYAANDIVLLVLWGMAARQEPSYLSVFFCFVAFLLNDLYGYISWRRMQRRQGK